jgi:Meiotically up-regulated gene 113
MGTLITVVLGLFVLTFAIEKWKEIGSILLLCASVAIGYDFGWIIGLATFVLGGVFIEWLSSTQDTASASSLAYPSETGDYFTYVLGDGFCHKVGIAKDPFSRLKQLQTGHPNKLELLRTYKFQNKSDAFELEQLVHRDLFSCRAEGEWFNAPLEAIEASVKKFTS